MLSRLVGPNFVPPPKSSLVEALRVLGRSDRPWLISHRGRNCDVVTGSGALDSARRWARAFQDAGVRAGDRVIITQPNGLDFVASFFGAQLARAIPVPISFPFMLAHVVDSLRPVEPLVRRVEPAAFATTPEVARIIAASDLAWDFPGVTEPAASVARADYEPEPETPCFIQFTSGTTKVPKGAVISHRAAVSSAAMMGAALEMTSLDVGLSWLPMFHDMGLVGALFCSLLYEFPLHVLAPAEFLLHPGRWLDVASRARATITAAPNFAYELVTRRVKPAFGQDLASLRAALNGAEPVHAETIDSFEARFAAAELRAGVVTPVYGLAENTLGACFTRPFERDPVLTTRGRRVPSVGRPLPGVTIEVRDGDGRAVDEGTEGEITLESPSAMSEYYRAPDETARILRQGWLSTGDLGVIDGGRLYVTGRKKDLVIKGGRNFHPSEIERVVAATVDAPPNGVAAFAELSPARGSEDLVVIVELRREAEADAEHAIRGRLLAELGIRADRIQIVRPGVLPRTTSGKLKRAECAVMFGGAESRRGEEPSP